MDDGDKDGGDEVDRRGQVGVGKLVRVVRRLGRRRRGGLGVELLVRGVVKRRRRVRRGLKSFHIFSMVYTGEDDCTKIFWNS